MQRLYATALSKDKNTQSLFNFRRLCFIFSLLLCFFPASAGELPDLGNSASVYLTPAQEYELGYNVIKELHAFHKINEDPIINEYLQGIGNRLVATQGVSAPPYHFFLVNDKTVNAFALPGGFVGVNTGLILVTDSESELASVLAHEVAHVQQKHIARMYEHMGRLRLSTIAGMVAAMILATQSPELAQGAIAATLGGNQQALINFTREHEKEADSIGMQNLAKAGFDPMGMPGFFQRMHQETRFYGNHIPEFFLTHPVTESRLMVAKSRAQNYPYKQIPDSLQYHLVQARVKFLSFSSSVEASNYFSKLLKRGNYRSRLGTLYGYSLALIAQGKPQEAREYLNELILAAPTQPLFELAYAHLEMEEGKKSQAFSRLESALKNHPDSNPLTLALGEWLIKDNKPNEAVPLLKRQATRKRTHTQIWKLLSIAYANNKQPVEAHLAQAQYLKAQGDFMGATIQVKLAKKVSQTQTEKLEVETAEQGLPKV
jgi:beta-barrel assembly-enhancing protease